MAWLGAYILTAYKPVGSPFSSPPGLQLTFLLLISQLDHLSAHLLASSLLKTIQDGWRNAYKTAGGMLTKLLTSRSDHLSAHLWACR